MSADNARTYGYYAVSHWFHVAIIFLLLSALGLWLLSALEDAKERAERLGVELTIRHMRTGLLYAMGEALMRQSEHEIHSWVGSNPIRWLAASPSGYLGVCSSTQRLNLVGGEWCFDNERKELVYQPLHVAHLHQGGVDTGEPCAQLSWRVASLPGAEQSGQVVGVRIESASACGWALQGA